MSKLGTASRESQSGIREVLGLVVPTQSQPINSHHFQTFRAVYNRHHDPHLAYPIWLTNPEQAGILHHQNIERVASRPRDTLWWRVFMSRPVGSKTVPINKCKKRAQFAFRQALRSRGLDKDGRRMYVAGSQDAETPQIYGSLAIKMRQNALTEPFKRFQADADALAEALLSRMRS